MGKEVGIDEREQATDDREVRAVGYKQHGGLDSSEPWNSEA